MICTVKVSVDSSFVLLSLCTKYFLKYHSIVKSIALAVSTKRKISL